MLWTQIVQSRSGDVVILEVRGFLTLSGSPADLVTLINRLAGQGDRKILLNLFQTPYIDSEGLADIIKGLRIARNAGGDLRLCEVAERIRELLNVTELASVIQAFDSEEEALNSFRSVVDYSH
jgi:anti-sigma B factor antagonist